MLATTVSVTEEEKREILSDFIMATAASALFLSRCGQRLVAGIITTLTGKDRDPGDPAC